MFLAFAYYLKSSLEKTSFAISKRAIEEDWEVTVSSHTEDSKKTRRVQLKTKVLKGETINGLSARLEKNNPYSNITIIQTALKHYT